jgi:hypothetical protein
MFLRNKIVAIAVIGSLSTGILGIGAAPVLADNAGAFIGGVFASRLMHNVRRNADSQESMARSQAQQSQPQPVIVAPAPAPAPAQLSPQARIQQLDKLAAGGYITADEYKAKKQAIIDGM